MDHRDILLALNAAKSITRAALCRLGADLDAWHDAIGAARLREADSARLASSLGVPAEPLRRALEVAGRADRLAAEERKLAEEARCRIVTLRCADYPKALLDHPLPPPVLYLRGRLPDAPAVAVVGSRGMNAYGREATRLFAGGLARAGVVVVSGFALGVDQAAHRATLEAGGKTVAVLGCGIDIAYPSRTRDVAERIAGAGALVSEFPIGLEPRAWHFPVRNRVIAALSLGTLVVQAKARSGSLITAHRALDLGRDVWAVPGGIFDELSQGTNELIVDGAALVLSPDDVLDHIGLGDLAVGFGAQRGLFGRSSAAQTSEAPVPEKTEPPLPKGLGGKLVRALRNRGAPCTAEELGAAADVTVERVLGALLELELAGWIERLPGPVYAA